MNLQIAAGALAVTAALSFSAGWKVQGWRWAASERAALEEARVREEQLRAEIDKASTGYEADRAKLRTEFRTIFQEVERVVEKPVYRDRECLDDDGLRVLRSAIRGDPVAPGEPAGAVR